MANTCSKCGQPLSLVRRLTSNLCASCQVELDRLAATAAQAEADAEAQLERDAASRRYAAALHGEASANDLLRLAADGYLIAGDRLICCPVCGHDRFHQQRTLMNTRAATFFNFDWADNGADTRICQRCAHVMWFAR